MDILLIKPPQETNEIQPPLGLGYIASNIKDICNVKILDCIKEKYSSENLIEYINKNSFDIIGLQCYSVDMNTIKKISDYLKSKFPNTLLVVGGPQPSLDPIGTLDYLKNVDYGFCGEAEESFREFILSINKTDELEKIPGIIYRKEGKIFNNKNKVVENLDRFSPSWELFNLKTYPVAPHGAFFKQFPTAPIITTRGCPSNCTYCGGRLISGRKIRRHSVSYIIKQIELLYNEYGIREIHIEDDNFTIDRNFVVEFCNKLLEKNLGISWAVPNGVRLDTLNEETLKLMKRVGLYSVTVGIESGSDRIRKLMKKNLDTETITKQLNMVRKCDLGIIGTFILGYPGETVEEINQTIDFSLRLPLNRATFSAFKPFPETEIYNELKKENKLGYLDWEKFSLDKVVWSPEGISKAKLKNLRRKAFLKFYNRPEILFKMCSEIRSFNHLKFIIIRIFRWMI